VREAVIQMNLLPCRSETPGTHTDLESGEFQDFSSAAMSKACITSESQLTTPHELFYDLKPDYHVHCFSGVVWATIGAFEIQKVAAANLICAQV
jgi:hypothetical protein